MNRPQHIAIALAVALGLFFAAPAALAAAVGGSSGGGFMFDPSALINTVVGVVTTLALAVFALLKSRLPKFAVSYLEQMHFERMLTAAIGYGAARVKGAGFNKPIKVDVGNAWINMALEYLAAPERQDFYLRHGREMLENAILARLPIAQEEAVAPPQQ